MRGFHGETIGSNGYVTRAPASAAAAVGCAVIEVSANRLGYTAAPVSLVGHTHDDRYYTESELNALLNAKFDKTGGVVSGVVACNALEVDAAYYVYWTGRSCLTSSADGLVHVQNFNLNESVDQVLVFGPGTTPGNGLRLKRPVGTSVLHVKNGNDSAYADLLASKLYVYNVNGNPWIESFSNSGIQVWGGAGGLGAVKAREFQVDPTGYLYFGARGIVASSANGVIHVHNYDLNDATADQVLALGPATSASNGVRLKRAMGTTVVNLRNGNDSADASLTCAHLTLTGLFSPGTYTVATLPAASANPGKTAEVTDSSVTTYRSTVAGGGSNRVNVKSNGTTWLVN